MTAAGTTPAGARSVVIGQGTPPVVCADILRKHGHAIVAVCSPDEPLRAWAERLDVPHLATPAALDGYLAATALDYLFSVVNYHVIPAALLARPRELAINYHDGPLPRYAGTWATSWALMNRESAHGVTWHVMVDEIDAGDVLRQAAVQIAPDDTAASLNRKCFVTAVRAFDVLVRELGEGTATRTPQDLSARTYFPFHRRPPDACHVDLARDAADVSAFVRALSFAPYDNPLGTPKVRLGDAWLTVGAVEVLDGPATGEPGAVVATDGSAVTVSARDHDVVLRGLTTLAGAPVSIAPGASPARVSAPDAAEGALITAAYQRAARSEGAWARRLAACHPADLAAADDGRASDAPGLDDDGAGRPAADADAADVLGGIAARLARRIAHGTHVALSTPALRRAVDGLEELFSIAVPATLADLASASDAAAVERRFTFARDLARRMPERSLVEVGAMPIAVVVVEAGAPLDDPPFRGTRLTIVASEDGRSRWHHHPPPTDARPADAPAGAGVGAPAPAP